MVWMKFFWKSPNLKERNVADCCKSDIEVVKCGTLTKNTWLIVDTKNASNNIEIAIEISPPVTVE